MLLTKQEELELVRTLVDSQALPELLAVRRLVEHRLAEAKDRLVECPVADLQRYQGVAAAYASLLKDLTRKKPNITAVPA